MTTCCGQQPPAHHACCMQAWQTEAEPELAGLVEAGRPESPQQVRHCCTSQQLAPVLLPLLIEQGTTAQVFREGGSQLRRRSPERGRGESALQQQRAVKQPRSQLLVTGAPQLLLSRAHMALRQGLAKTCQHPLAQPAWAAPRGLRWSLPGCDTQAARRLPDGAGRGPGLRGLQPRCPVALPLSLALARAACPHPRVRGRRQPGDQ